jgi:hypothetical protein
MSCPVHRFLQGQIDAQRILGPEPKEGYTYSSIAEYVFDNSVCSQGRTLTKSEAFYVALCKRKAFDYWGGPKPQACYSNAQELVTADAWRVLEYVEGFACHRLSSLPVLHSWVELNGAIIDTTPVWHDTLDGTQPTSCYHGAFRAKRRVILDRMVKDSRFHSFIDDWQNGFPLLKETSR